MDRLPDVILEEIFTYCTFEDLVWNIPEVNSRWRLLSSRCRVWKRHTYYPGAKTSGKGIIEVLRRCPKLQAVNLQKQVFGKEVFEVLANNCPDLAALYFDYFQSVSCEILTELQQKCPKIEFLDVSEEVICYPEKMEIIGRFMNLKKLSSKRSIGKVTLKPIADGCPKLECLEIGEANVDLDDLRYFLSKKKNTLRTIELPCRIPGGVRNCTIPLLSVCTGLESVCIHWNCETESDILVRTLSNLKTLKSLTWQDLSFSSRNSEMHLFGDRKLAHLQRLELCSFPFYDDNTTKVIVDNCPNLQGFHLSICQAYTDKTLEMIMELKHLKELGIYGNKIITDNGIKYLAGIKQLEALLLGGCENLTSKSLHFLLSLSNLKVLKFICQSVKNCPWQAFPEHLKHLKYLEVYRCHNLDSRAVKFLKEKMPQVVFSVDDSTLRWGATKRPRKRRT